MPFIKVGALWARKSEKTGKTYLSGVIRLGEEEIKISVWKNDKGDNPKRPDYVIQSQIESPPPEESPEPEDNDSVPF